VVLRRSAPTLSPSLARRGVLILPGLLACLVVAAVATGIGALLPIVGSAVPAIVIGVLIALVRRPPRRFDPGLRFSGKFVLQCAVVLLGAQLSIPVVLEVGAGALPVMLSSLAVCLLGAWLIGRAMKVDPGLRTLIGVGTGICGASAIAAVAPVIRAKSAQISYALSTIFLFNILAVVIFPMIGHALGMSPHAFGLFAGTAVNDTSSVVAAASVYGVAALGYAVVVKLVRTLMIIPISVGLAALQARRTGEAERLSARRIVTLVPWFLVGFLVMTALRSVGVVPPPAAAVLTHVSVFLVAVALAGIGMSTDVAAIRRAGWRPLALGAILWVLVTATTLATMLLTGAL